MTNDNTAIAISGLTAEVAGLKDLFYRRLMEDKARNALYEALQAQARASQDLLKHRALESLMLEALLAIDRLQNEVFSRELAESVADELLEVFARRSLRPIDDSGAFNPRAQEVVGTIAAGIDTPEGTIVAVHRRGYVLDDKLLRPAQVTIATAASTVPAVSLATTDADLT